MSIIPCQQNAELRRQIEELAAKLASESHKLTDHGLSLEDFNRSGIFRGAIERIRGQFSATMVQKREFAAAVLNHMKKSGAIKDWSSAGSANRHDYGVELNSGRSAAIELKGCLDGNNTNIFERPHAAHEFVIWSVCANQGADPRKNAWSGIHTRLSAEIISREQRVDGVVVWDMICGTLGRPCPKLAQSPERRTAAGDYSLPPPCIYLFPGTVPSARGNPRPPPQGLKSVEFLQALATCFKAAPDEIHSVWFEVRHSGADTQRRTIVERGGKMVQESGFTAIRRR